MFEFLTLKPEAFGIDISDLSLKIIKLKREGGVFGLASFGETVIKPGIIEKGEIKDEDALAEIIKKALTEVSGEKLKTKYTVASLPEEKAFLRVIPMPLMKEEEMKKAVYFESESHIPLPIDKAYLDAQRVPSIQNHLDHLDVLIAALPKTTIDPYLSSLKKAGLKPLVLEIESQAISRALVKNEKSSEPLLLIDLGASRTSFIIFSGCSLRFTSSRPICAQDFTEAISQGLKMSLPKAEKFKIKHGIEKDKEGKKTSKILEPQLINLVNQIKKYLEYYKTHSAHEHLPLGGKGVKKIILCGGGANLKGLSDFLSFKLKLQVELGNPWANILPSSLREVPELSYQESLRYTTALGLALRGSCPKL